MARIRVAVTMALVALLLSGGLALAPPPVAAEECAAFPETGKAVCGRFLAYWRANGGLAQQGLPLTDVFDETNPTDGKAYKTQYFERARFELHPENQAPFDVLLGLLGREQFRAKYPAGAPSLGHGGERCFPETGFCARGRFYAYWLANGGLAQQGLPISPEFLERNPTDGKEYLTQYFERARFEAHPEHAAPFDVLLGLLGREQLATRPPGDLPPNPEPPKPSAREAATVTQVVDGDTIRVRFADGRIDTVRYTGVDTPETVAPGEPVACYGPEASARNRQLVEGQTVALERDQTDRDRFGRLLRYVFVGGTHIGEALIREGYARSTPYPPDTRYLTAFDAAQAEARAARRGLWAACDDPSPPMPAPQPTPSPTPKPPSGGCDASYPTVCIPSPPPDLDCGDIPHRRFPVNKPDPHRFDSDNDGLGCES